MKPGKVIHKHHLRWISTGKVIKMTEMLDLLIMAVQLLEPPYNKEDQPKYEQLLRVINDVGGSLRLPQ